MTPIRVLLVEDNPGDADLARDTLEAGKVMLDIVVAVDGAEALDYVLRRGRHAAAAPPDLIFLDLNLPKLSGTEVLAEIRKHPELLTIPVVVLTSSDAERDIARSHQLGIHSYITKPIDFVTFQSIVKSIDRFWFTVVR